MKNLRPLPLTDSVSLSKRRLEAINKRLKAKNKAFAKLSKAEQRVAIAKDVIAQLKSRKLFAESGRGYLNPEVASGYVDVDDESVAELDVSQITSQVQCQVCGIGSLFVVAVEHHDKLKVKDMLNTWGENQLDNRTSQVKYLRKWFAEDQLDLVEDYFEQDGGDPESSSPILREPDDDVRLMMIMENIISNNGKFDPYNGKHKVDEPE